MNKLLILTIILISIVSGSSAQLDQHHNMSRTLARFWNSVFPRVSYHGVRVTRFAPEERSYWEAVSLASLVPVFLAVVSVGVGIVYGISMVVGRCGGCHCNVKRERAVPRKFVLVVCTALLIVGLIFGILANYWQHQITIRHGVDHIVQETKSWQEDANTIDELSKKLNLRLPNDTEILFGDIKKTVETSVRVQTKVHRFEKFRNIFVYTFIATLYILSAVTLLVVRRFSRFLNLLIFFSILLVFLPLALLWIGGVQLPSCIFLGNLCTSYHSNMMRYVPEEDLHFAHYLTCEGDDPLADFTAEVRNTLDGLREEHPPPETVDDYETLLAALNDFSCDSHMRPLFEYEEKQICTRLLNDASMLFFVLVGIIVIFLVILLGGLRLRFSGDKEGYQTVPPMADFERP